MGGGLPDDPVVRRDIITEVQALYGLTEQQAVGRLAAEVEAAQLDRLIRNLELDSYAGSWFDGGTWKLHVAISASDDLEVVKDFGATPVLVPRSLRELETIRSVAATSVSKSLAATDTYWTSHVDNEMNKVVIGVIPKHIVRVEAALGAAGLGPGVAKVVATSGEIEFSAAVRGADPMCNQSFTQPPFINPTCHDHPCSIGASIVGGYVTAGHCGEEDNIIYSDPPSGSGQLLGVMNGSTMTLGSFGYQFANDQDSGWVETEAGWTPQPKVNGYSQGVFPVNAKWSGLLEAPEGTMVCRYGQNPNGTEPDCGPIDEKDYIIYSAGTPYLIVTTVESVCTFPGDSGGPYVMATGQIQGTNFGGTGGITCPPQSTDRTYFQPIKPTLSYFTYGGQPLIMLTTHGAVKPTTNGFRCPDFNGNGHYFCTIDSYNSQGSTDIQWSSNTGASSTTIRLTDDCLDGQTVNVTLDVSNPYGTRILTRSFTCHGGSPF